MLIQSNMIPKKLPETKQEILGYWILQILEFHSRLQQRKYLTTGDWNEMKSLDNSLIKSSTEAGISLETNPGIRKSNN
jgi:hypothetical protein